MSEQITTPEVDQTLELNNEMLERRSKLAALRAQQRNARAGGAA